VWVGFHVDITLIVPNNLSMSTIEKNIELEEAARFAVTGQGDPAILKHIDEQCALLRQELRKKFGLTNIAVELIREVREE
jgi:hypothetical protein